MKNMWARKKLKIETVPPIVSRLYAGKIITNKEKRKLAFLQPKEMKAEIFDMISHSHPSVATKIFLAIRSVKDEKETQKEGTFTSHRNPMEINTIIRHLFGYLGVQDLKSCRFVCQKWNAEAEPQLKKRATITFGALSPSKLRHPKNFLKTFRHFSFWSTNLPFTSFRFFNANFRGSEFKTFLVQQKSNIQRLQLADSITYAENYYVEEERDITDWLADLSVSELAISCYHKWLDLTKFTISSNVLTSIKNIELDQCNIKIENGKPIAPVSIDLTDIKFWRDGTFLAEFCLNDLIDFSKTKDIKIKCYGEDDEQYTLPRLDLSKCLSANHVALASIKAVNWTKFKSPVEVLSLDDIPFVSKTNLEFKELHFNGSRIDLLALPLSIEKIYFGEESQTNISCSQPLIFSNLKFLKVGHHENFPVLNYFANCCNLRDIELISEEMDTDVTLDLDWIPRSVQRMSLKGVGNHNIISRSEGKFTLDKLVLDISLANADKIMDKITPATLAIRWDGEFETSASLVPFLEKYPDLVLYIGPLLWGRDDKADEFEMSPLVGHVDKKALWYVFENNQGRAIEGEEMTRVSCLDKY